MNAADVTDRVHHLLRDSLYGLRLDHDGDAYVEEGESRCHVVIAGDEHPHVVLFAIAAEGLTASPELFRWVATRADTTLCQVGAHVRDDETVAVSVRETVRGDSVDGTDLEFALVTVVYVATELAREIAARFLSSQR